VRRFETGTSATTERFQRKKESDCIRGAFDGDDKWRDPDERTWGRSDL
jgi:hypothetical protein